MAAHIYSQNWDSCVDMWSLSAHLNHHMTAFRVAKGEEGGGGEERRGRYYRWGRLHMCNFNIPWKLNRVVFSLHKLMR